MKPYHSVPIQDCGESLVALSAEQFSLVTPHPYQSLGAPYGDKSPFFVRERVLERLCAAQDCLRQQQPTWRIQIFDAYRPIPVQQFMVDYSFAGLLQENGLTAALLTPAQTQVWLDKVYQFWAPPSLDPATPPPHSTGAAIDVTLVDEQSQEVPMGSPIDELSPRSYPNHFAGSLDPDEQTYHTHRQILFTAMDHAGFQQHPNEWWHFSWGDQLWAWQTQQQTGQVAIAHYGRAAF